MRLALITDIHSNREGFSAVLDDLQLRKIDRIVMLGDLVGYGPDPEWCVDRAMRLVEEGALAVKGNHDSAIANPSENMNAVARAAIEWTRPRLDREAKQFLAALPMIAEQGDSIFVHASLNTPENWDYITNERRAASSFRQTQARLITCGHTHVPLLISLDTRGSVQGHAPSIGSTVPLISSRRWLAVIGSAGQPRDGNPRAAYAIVDQNKNEIEFRRVAYDVSLTAQKIRNAGLPEPLAARLLKGK